MDAPNDGSSPTNKDDGEGSAASSFQAAGQYAGLGLQFAMAVGLFTWLGWIADNRLEWTPLLTIVGAFVGAGGGFYSMYRRLVLDPQRQEHEE